jgi:hypothetical protein
MQSKTIIGVLLAIVLVLGAALAAVPILGLLGLSFVTIARSEGAQSAPVIESNSIATGAQTGVGNPEAGAECSAPIELPAQEGRISYGGISFALDPSLGSSVKMQTCPAGSPDPTIMPGGSHPAYTAFIFPSDRSNVDFRPELRVYKVGGDMSGFTYPLNSLAELKTFLQIKSQSAFWFDKAPLHARQGYLDFQNGSGARALVQYMQDHFFYTNNGLTYEFNGLTSDGGTFISLRYPVSVPFLMTLDGTQVPGSQDSPVIAIPEWPEEYEKQGAIIEAYNSEARLRLEQMQAADAWPDLSVLDSLVGSLQVQQ